MSIIRIYRPEGVGRILRAMRLEAGISLAGMEKHGVAKGHVWQAESGTHLPRLTTILKFARAAGYDLAFIPRDPHAQQPKGFTLDDDEEEL